MNTPFQLVQDEWIQIAPLGDHPHAQGLQRIDAGAVAAMAQRFNGFGARLGRLFSGVPMFEGHHDTDPEKYPNGRSFAWIMELQDRAGDGLWGRLKWTPEGKDLVQKGSYKFVSPVWTAREIARENGQPIYRPETLLSLGLTNLPNLPLPPLANEKSKMKTLLEILELANDATADQIVETVTQLKAQAATLANQLEKVGSTLAPLPPSEPSAVEKLRLQDTELSALRNEAENLRKSTQFVDEQFAQERAARIDLILANALLSGRITLAQKEHWRAELQTDLPAAESELAKAPAVLNHVSQTEGLGNAKNLFDTEATRRNFLNAFITEKMTVGLTHLEAWNLARAQHPDLFARMGAK